MSFNEKLQMLRKKNKLSQEGLADKLDVTRQSVSKWESGITYPEMDKLLSICKLFNCSLEELTNDEIKEISAEKKNGFSNIVDSILDFINRSYNYFTNINMKGFIKCAFIMLIVFLIICILRRPFILLTNGIHNMLFSFGQSNVSNFIYYFFKIIIDIVYVFGGILLFTYIFKIGFLDNKFTKVKDDESDEVKASPEEIKMVTKEPKTRQYSFFNGLGSVIMFLIKLLLVFFCIPFIVSFILLFIMLVLDIYLIFKGVFFIGILLGILFCILLNALLLIFIYNILFNRKQKYKILLILLLVGIGGLGVSLGFITLDFNNIKYYDQPPKNINNQTITYKYNFTKDLVLDTWYDVDYKIDNTQKNEILVGVTYYPKFNNMESTLDNNKITINYNNDYIYSKDITNLIITNLKDKTLYNYSKLSDVKVTITTSEDNIKTIKNNTLKIAQSEDEYENNIQKYEDRINDLEERNTELQDKNTDLQDKLNDYETKIKDIN